MTENEAFAIIRAQMLSMLRELGYVDVRVIAGRQPNKSGRIDNSIYYFSIAENRQGIQGRRYNPNQEDVGHNEREPVTKTVQVQAFRKLGPEDYESYTATDLCAVAKMIFGSLPFIEAVRAQGVSVSNITNIREPEFVNESGDYEKNPSFDVDVGFMRELKPITQWLSGYSETIYPVE